MTASVKRSGDELRIYINNILHLLITDRITSIQSWNEEDKWYKIEIQTKHNSVLLEYDSFEKWKKILELING